MAPLSVSAVLAPSPPPAAKVSPHRTPARAAPVAAAAVSTALLGVTPAANAAAFSKVDVADSVTKVVDTVDQIIGFGGKVAEQSAGVLKALGEAAKPALPALKTAGEQALKLASPVVSGVSKQATEALQGAGVDPAPVLSAAKTVADAAQQGTKVIDAAKPIASATVETIGSLGSADYVVVAGAAFLAYLLLPPAWSLLSFTLRGYKGDLTAAQALDMVTSQDYVLIDVRTEKDKAKAGVPQLPSNAKNKLISIPLEELPSKTKSMVRNAKQAEAEIAALKISYLKRIGKGSNVIIMNSYWDNSKIVARTLNSVGFKNCWVMAGGFSGRKGWVQSRLGTDSYNLSVVEVVTPSRVIPAASDRFVTTSSTSRTTTSRKLLPGSVDG
ncbi:hypothetical protein E2562_010391 [Oryza meyeriana var. granulata]|uniref:Rhodanese domain-containing protein n=1 Tax=Oryza meyeriana var. granulata TaxID=110450 RepID=A0A6G1F6M8_9ORYZ|nr:hypothetical protein E2562_010391 [Oryza meyeriana var. granulata]